jgi:Spy/CpxP family protein refolding chaperone
MQGEGGANQSRRAAVLLVLAVLVLGIALGVLGTYLEGYRVFGAALIHRTPPDHSPAALQRGRQAKVDRFNKELDLSADQQKQLDSVLAQMQTKYSGVHEQFRGQMDQVHKQGSDAIRAILTPEQAAKFDDVVKKMDEERKKQQGNN